MLGKLTIAAFIHGPIVLSAQIFMVVAGIALVAILFYFKRWKWLWKEWLTSLDPKKIGIMYLVVGVVMMFRGFVDAAMMRTQQATSVGASHGFLASNHFEQVFTGHGVIMILFVAMPLIVGLFNLIIPLQIGARDVAFPFLNSISFWLFFAGAALVLISLAIGDFAATGWLAYPPLSEISYSPGVGVDYWIWALEISGIGTLLTGINFLVTILKMRAPGMTLMRMPMFVWTSLCSIVMIIFAFPVLTGTITMLFLDRMFGMHFFTASFGGNMMMYVNLIWAWGHPEVYIIMLPLFGVWSEIVATFSRKRLFGYTSMVLATMAIALLSFIVWLHHFFTMGAGADVNAFFGIMTMIIAIPTGVKLFNWIFTMYRGRIHFASPMYWFFGFVFTFTLGGMSGVLLAVPGIDFQLHNSLFLVAHFHNVIIGGVVFGLFAGFTYWFPKFFGFTLNEKLGKYAFWSWLIGFWLAFGPLYILGIMGATRRLDHYSASTGWQPFFMVAAIGVLVLAAGGFFQVLQYIKSAKDRKQNLDTSGDPWDGRTLEWSIPSPAPVYSFARIPRVHSRDAFWEEKYGDASSLAQPEYEDIYLPKNTSLGVIIGAFAFVFGFAIVWHIFWILPIAFVGILSCIIVRSFQEETEYCITAEEVQRTEKVLAA
jgi:cytochrome o ubiquinol oxidase subunit 1